MIEETNRIPRGPKEYLSVAGNTEMHERVKMFTFVSGHGETLVDPPHEGHLNQWLASIEGQIVDISQSESGGNGGHHVTICVWYLPRGEGDA